MEWAQSLRSDEPTVNANTNRPRCPTSRKYAVPQLNDRMERLARPKKRTVPRTEVSPRKQAMRQKVQILDRRGGAKAAKAALLGTGRAAVASERRRIAKRRSSFAGTPREMAEIAEEERRRQRLSRERDETCPRPDQVSSVAGSTKALGTQTKPVELQTRSMQATVDTKSQLLQTHARNNRSTGVQCCTVQAESPSLTKNHARSKSSVDSASILPETCKRLPVRFQAALADLCGVYELAGAAASQTAFATLYEHVQTAISIMKDSGRERPGARLLSESADSSMANTSLQSEPVPELNPRSVKRIEIEIQAGDPDSTPKATMRAGASSRRKRKPLLVLDDSGDTSGEDESFSALRPTRLRREPSVHSNETHNRLQEDQKVKRSYERNSESRSDGILDELTPVRNQPASSTTPFSTPAEYPYQLHKVHEAGSLQVGPSSPCEQAHQGASLREASPFDTPPRRRSSRLASQSSSHACEEPHCDDATDDGNNDVLGDGSDSEADEHALATPAKKALQDFNTEIRSQDIAFDGDMSQGKQLLDENATPRNPKSDSTFEEKKTEGVSSRRRSLRRKSLGGTPRRILNI